jgi:hypothetical protein
MNQISKIKQVLFGKPKTVLSIVVLLGALLAVEIVVRSPGFWTFDPQSTTGTVSSTADFTLARAPEPKIVFLGSSRVRYSVSPKVVAESFGLAEEEVASIGFDWGKPIDYLAIYQDNREVFQNADLLVIEVGARAFNWQTEWKQTKPRFRQHAGLWDRLRVPDSNDKLDMTVGWFWKTWDTRHVLRSYAEKTMDGQFSMEGFPKPHPPVDELGRMVGGRRHWTMYTRDSIPVQLQPEEYPSRYAFKDFDLSEVQLDKLTQLVNLAREDGLEVVIMESPLSPVTIAEIQKNFAEEDALWRIRVEESTGLPVTVVLLEHDSCADWKLCYFDHGHMSSTGSQAYSKLLGDWLMNKVTRVARAK